VLLTVAAPPRRMRVCGIATDMETTEVLAAMLGF
jgi:hypothetical protein